MMIFWIVFAVLIYLIIGYCIDMDLRDGHDTPHVSFIKKLYEKEKDNEWSYVDDISDIDVSVAEIESDMAVDIELGGYCE